MKKNLFLEDKHLLSDIKMSNKNAFAFLFRKYYPILFAYCCKFIEQEDAEEIVQDVMLWLWENRTTLQIDTSLSQYLFRSVYHRAMDKIASKQSQNRADTLFYEQTQEMLQDTDYYQIEELTKRIKEAIDKLPESYRESFIMHRFQDMSYKEIGAQLGISHKTVDYRIQQALKLLRIELKDYLPMILPLLLVQSGQV